MLIRALYLLCVAVSSWAVAAPAWAQKRHAFVVGVQDYQHPMVRKLRTAKADAEEMGSRLASFGYAVERAIDVTSAEMKARWLSWLSTVNEGDVVVVFFATHGMEVASRNYLLLRDAAPVAAGQLPTSHGAVGAFELLQDLTKRKPAATVLILDACRDDPWNLGKLLPGGLALMVPPPGSFVLFSAGAFERALDYVVDPKIEKNSPFTTELLVQMSRRDFAVSALAEKVRAHVWKVAAKAKHNQSPAYNDQLKTRLCIAGDCAESKVAVTAAEAADDCTSLAAYARVRDGRAEGVDWYALDALIAVPACKLAVELNPEENRLQLLLARAYTKMARFDLSTPIFKHMALAGNADAMSEYGYALVKGQGDEIDRAEGLKWIRASSAAGSAAGHHHLGEAHLFGFGTPPDLPQSVTWYERGKSSGALRSWLRLGNAYVEGKGVRVDTVRGLAYYEEAAALGSVEANGNVGWLYMNGYSVPKDVPKAMTYLEKAADLGSTAAMTNIGLLHERGDLGPTNLEAARKWYEKAYQFQHEPDSKNAARGLGWLAEQRKDYAAAQHYYKEAIRRGEDADAYTLLGHLLWHGRGSPKSAAAYRQACDHYKRAADLGNARGMVAYGWCFEVGNGVDAKDLPGAARLYEQAADLGNDQAMNNLANLLLEGRGAPRNESRAIELYVRARNEGNGAASFNLSRLHFYGIGVQQDPLAGLRFLEEAGERENEQAQESLCMKALLHAETEGGGNFSWCERVSRENGAGGLADVVVGVRHLKGLGVPRSALTAESFLRKAEANGQAGAKCFLAAMLDNRSATGRDALEAAKLFLACWTGSENIIVEPNANAWSVAFRTKLQELLKLEGYYDGPIDGVLDARTYRALEAAREQRSSR